MKRTAVLVLSAAFFSFLWGESRLTPEMIRKAERFADPAFCKQALDTPARYSAQLRGGWEHLALRLKDPRHPRYAAAVRLFARIHDEVLAGMKWKETLPKAAIPRFAAPPAIDGIIKPEEWKNALVYRGEYPLNQTRRSEKYEKTSWRIGWHGNTLYVAAEFEDRNITPYHGRFSTPDLRPLYMGDAFELFIRPIEGKPLYHEYLVNPQGILWALVHVNDPRGSWIRICDDFPTKAETAVRVTKNGYSLELSVPLGEMYGPWRNRPSQTGHRFSFMMIRTHRDGERYFRTAPVPLLYEGHNIFGYIKAELVHGPAMRHP